MSHENAQAMVSGRRPGHRPGPEDFAVASTGVIGQTINITAIQAGMPPWRRGGWARRAPRMRPGPS